MAIVVNMTICYVELVKVPVSGRTADIKTDKYLLATLLPTES